VTTTLALTPAQHLVMAEEDFAAASDAYDQAETIRDRATAQQWRRIAEALTESANRHYALAGDQS
jgi:hypothetical protein